MAARYDRGMVVEYLIKQGAAIDEESRLGVSVYNLFGRPTLIRIDQYFVILDLLES